MKTKKTVKHIKRLLGAPVRHIEVSDNDIKALIKTATKDFAYYNRLGDKRILSKNVKNVWVRLYATALTKEVLGRVMGKFSGVVEPPENERVLDYKSLLSESAIEKDRLINEISR